MHLTSVFVGLVAGAVGVHALQSNMATGFACLNGFYGADMAGAASSLTSVTYSPLGVCVPTSQYPGVGGVIFSADATNKLYASYFATSSCGAQATQLTLAQLTTAGIVTGTSTTVATTTAGVSDVQCDTAALTAVGVSAVGMPYGLTATSPLTPLVGQVGYSFSSRLHFLSVDIPTVISGFSCFGSTTDLSLVTPRPSPRCPA